MMTPEKKKQFKNWGLIGEFLSNDIRDIESYRLSIISDTKNVETSQIDKLFDKYFEFHQCRYIKDEVRNCNRKEISTIGLIARCCMCDVLLDQLFPYESIIFL